MSEFEEKLFSVSATLRTRQVHKRFSLTNGRLDWTHQQCLGMKYTTTTTALQNTIYIYCLRNLYLHLTFFHKSDIHVTTHSNLKTPSIHYSFLIHSLKNTILESFHAKQDAWLQALFHSTFIKNVTFLSFSCVGLFSDIFIHNELWSTNTSWLLH